MDSSTVLKRSNCYVIEPRLLWYTAPGSYSGHLCATVFIEGLAMASGDVLGQLSCMYTVA